MERIDLYLSLGSNLGDRRQNILDAIKALEAAFGKRSTARSPLIETAPWGPGVTAPFLNACARWQLVREADAAAQAHAILAVCQGVERRLGRSAVPLFDADGQRVYHDRPIDIDILFFGAETIDSEILTVPHPLIAQRDFVLIPLRQIAKASLKRTFPEFFTPKPIAI